MKAKISLLLVVLIFSVLALFDWNFVHDTIIAPIHYLIWAGNIILKSIPLQIYLLFLLLAGIILGLSTIQNVRERSITKQPDENQPQAETRYLHWKRLCANVDNNWFSRNQFASDARELLISILAYKAEIDVTEAEKLVSDGTLQIPDVISMVIREKKIMEQPDQRTGNPSVLWQSQDTSPVETQIDEIIRFLEHYLEIDHAGSHLSN